MSGTSGRRELYGGVNSGPEPSSSCQPVGGLAGDSAASNESLVGTP